jgi:hypothetical protein
LKPLSDGVIRDSIEKLFGILFREEVNVEEKPGKGLFKREG